MDLCRRKGDFCFHFSVCFSISFEASQPLWMRVFVTLLESCYVVSENWLLLLVKLLSPYKTKILFF